MIILEIILNYIKALNLFQWNTQRFRAITYEVFKTLKEFMKKIVLSFSKVNLWERQSLEYLYYPVSRSNLDFRSQFAFEGPGLQFVFDGPDH